MNEYGQHLKEFALYQEQLRDCIAAGPEVAEDFIRQATTAELIAFLNLLDSPNQLKADARTFRDASGTLNHPARQNIHTMPVRLSELLVQTSLAVDVYLQSALRIVELSLAALDHRGWKYDFEKRRATLDAPHRQTQFFNQMVRETYHRLGFTGQGNQETHRRRIADELAPYFPPAMLGWRSRDKISMALKDYTDEPPNSDSRN